jgi:hypothetical protein
LKSKPYLVLQVRLFYSGINCSCFKCSYTRRFIPTLTRFRCLAFSNICGAFLPSRSILLELFAVQFCYQWRISSWWFLTMLLLNCVAYISNYMWKKAMVASFEVLSQHSPG